jgi:hypothetical protein
MSSKKMNFVQYSFKIKIVKRKKAEFHLKNCLAKKNWQRRELPCNARPIRLLKAVSLKERWRKNR